MASANGKVTLVNRYGLHQRPAMKVIETSSRFKSDIFLFKGEQRCNAKSIIDVIMLAAEKGTELRVEASGDDAPQAVAALEELFANKFNLGDE
ncbi:MAG: HPr family phosphocarrier protein [Planctomycetes bacterium]|nr:HPr family phosphocarrier protein [Planctomycetota bacterium]NUQ35424.1 HPr family phosphocarrier protein [Planctomycetaceae bacterium]